MSSRFAFLRRFFLRFLQWVWVCTGLFFPLYWRGKKDTYLFLPINGAGLGHLTRSLAIARRVKQLQPNARIVFLTTSVGVMLVHRAGFECHHVSPKALLSVGDIRWNLLFYKTLRMVLSIHRPSGLIFDGTMPYLGLRRVMRGVGSVRYVWVKRGLYKSGIVHAQLERDIKRFDFVISPGELVDDFSSGLSVGNVNKVPPIALLDREDLLGRVLARNILRIPQDAVCVYVQLGAGNINGVAGLQSKIVECLRRRNVQVVLGQSPISLKFEPDLLADCVIVDYPNSKYFRAFDFAILAAGYNSVCESVMLGLPTLFVPNMDTGADDQLLRAEMSTEFGPYKVLVGTDDEFALNQAIDALMTRTLVPSYVGRNGALDAAQCILQLGRTCRKSG